VAGTGEFNHVPLITKDRACNLSSVVSVRDECLDWLQTMRSNDLIWGTPTIWMQFSHVQEYIAGALGIDVGHYTHVTNSLHVYENFFDEAESIRPFDLYDQLHTGHSYIEQELHELEVLAAAVREPGVALEDTVALLSAAQAKLIHLCKLGDLTVIAGLRAENTDASYKAKLLTPTTTADPGFNTSGSTS
jgi:hypothetical protein